MQAIKQSSSLILVPCSPGSAASGGNQVPADINVTSRELGPLPLCAFGEAPKLLDVAVWARQQLWRPDDDGWWLLEYCCFGHRVPILSDEALQEAISYFEDEQLQQQHHYRRRQQQVEAAAALQEPAAAAAAAVPFPCPSKVYLWPVKSAPPWSLSDYLSCKSSGLQVTCTMLAAQPGDVQDLPASCVEANSAASDAAACCTADTATAMPLVAASQQQQQQQQPTEHLSTCSPQQLSWLSSTDAKPGSTRLLQSEAAAAQHACVPGSNAAAAGGNGPSESETVHAEAVMLGLPAANSGNNSSSGRDGCCGSLSPVATTASVGYWQGISEHAHNLTHDITHDNMGAWCSAGLGHKAEAGSHTTLMATLPAAHQLLLLPGNRVMLLPAAAVLSDPPAAAAAATLVPAAARGGGVSGSGVECCSINELQQHVQLLSCLCNSYQKAGMAAPAAQAAAAAANYSARLLQTQQQQQQFLHLQGSSSSSSAFGGAAPAAGPMASTAAAADFSAACLQWQHQQQQVLQSSSNDVVSGPAGLGGNALAVDNMFRLMQTRQQQQQQLVLAQQQQVQLQPWGPSNTDSRFSDFGSVKQPQDAPQMLSVTGSCNPQTAAGFALEQNGPLNQGATQMQTESWRRPTAVGVVTAAAAAAAAAVEVVPGLPAEHTAIRQSLAATAAAAAAAGASSHCAAAGGGGASARCDAAAGLDASCKTARGAPGRMATRTADGRYADPARHKQRLEVMAAAAAELFNGSMAHHWTINSHKSITCHLCDSNITPYAPYHPDCIRKHFIRHHEEELRAAGVDILACAKGIQLGKRKLAQLLLEKEEQQQQQQQHNSPKHAAAAVTAAAMTVNMDFLDQQQQQQQRMPSGQVLNDSPRYAPLFCDRQVNCASTVDNSNSSHPAELPLPPPPPLQQQQQQAAHMAAGAGVYTQPEWHLQNTDLGSYQPLLTPTLNDPSSNQQWLTTSQANYGAVAMASDAAAVQCECNPEPEHFSNSIGSSSREPDGLAVGCTFAAAATATVPAAGGDSAGGSAGGGGCWTVIASDVEHHARVGSPSHSTAVSSSLDAVVQCGFLETAAAAAAAAPDIWCGWSGIDASLAALAPAAHDSLGGDAAELDSAELSSLQLSASSEEFNSAELNLLNLSARCKELDSAELGALWDEWRVSEDVIMSLSNMQA